MPTRVLAFESDAQFARELDTQFRSLGCEVTVVDDVNLGLQAASVNKPDLILLTIELPRMSGYSVCNRIKRDADLKEIPLIILSSESTDQTFEQHKRLGTRAQDYVRKPVTFPQLLERVRKFVTLSANVSISPEDDGIVIDDEIELTEDSLISARPNKASVSPSHRPIDADIDDFAEHAFGVMLEAPASTKPSQRPSTGLDLQNASAKLPSVIPASPRVPAGM
jgi:DNA-binding response OmpR family regulator